MRDSESSSFLVQIKYNGISFFYRRYSNLWKERNATLDCNLGNAFLRLWSLILFLPGNTQEDPIISYIKTNTLEINIYSMVSYEYTAMKMLSRMTLDIFYTPNGCFLRIFSFILIKFLK